MITLTSISATIELPNPILGDSEQLNVNSKYEFSMSKKVHSSIKMQAPDMIISRSKLLITLDSLTTLKMEELKTFLLDSRGNTVTYVDYGDFPGLTYTGIILGDPFEFTQVARVQDGVIDSVECGERWSISLELEVTKIP